MTKNDIYHLLRTKILKYSDYVAIPVELNDEKLLPIPFTANLTTRQMDPQMLPYTGKDIYVRKTVLEKLLQASKVLELEHPELILEVVYGYRTLEIQTSLFEKQKDKLKDTFSGIELMEEVHKYIAVPDVAGHPAGAAVDVQLICNDQSVDFGTKIWEFVDDSLTFSPFVSKQAWMNRQLLRRIMMSVGFAPFDGEWWHFSYGDKEWAYYYRKPFAHYNQIKNDFLQIIYLI